MGFPTNSAWVYDTKEGVDLMTGSLHRLNILTQLRQKAGYERDERLTPFFILGRWHADSCGNFVKILPPFVPKDRFSDIPDVLTEDEFWNFLKAKSPGEEFHVMTSLGGRSIPPDRLHCPVCKKGWTILNCHDTVVHHTMENLPLDEFAGMTLGWAWQQLDRRNDAIYYMQKEVMIRHGDSGGFYGSDYGFDEHYIVRPGDWGRFNVWRYYHSFCNRQKLARDQRAQFRRIFIRAGFKQLRLKAIKNEYCGCEYCAPWFEVTTSSTSCGKFKIGWRKRVIDLDWSQTGRKFLRLFLKEEVTKGPGYIHAWGVDKCVDYLMRIRKALAS